MSIAPRTPDAYGEGRIVFHDMGWQDYQTLLTLFEEEHRRLPITYNQGTIEITSSHLQHERFKVLLGRIVVTISDEFDIPRVSAGSTTYHSEVLDCGLDPDDCFYLANAHRLRRYEEDDRMNPAVDPVPDLAIEIEMTRANLDKLVVYGALGIPEVWIFDGKVLKVFLLRNGGTYAESETSASFPFVPMADVNRFLVEHDATNDTRWARGVRQWVREVVEPRFRGQ